MNRAFDLDRPNVHVQYVRVDRSLDDRVREGDSVRCQELDERLRHDAATVVAAGRPTEGEVTWLEDVDVQRQIDGAGQAQQEVREEGSGRSASHDGDSGARLERKGAGSVECRLLLFLHVTRPSAAS